MSTAAQPRRPARWANILLAPMIWLEKARGRRRLALLVLYAIVLVALGVLIMRQTAINGLPDIGEPFDVAAFLREQRGQGPESEQPYVFYEQASRQFQRYELGGFPDPSSEGARQWAERNRAALPLWRKATDRTGPARRLENLQRDWPGPRAFVDFVGLSHLALFEAARLEAQGDLAGAWEWYRAVLRSTRQVMASANVIDREASARITAVTAGRLRNWAAQPGVSTALLQAALDQAVTLEAHAPPYSQTLRFEYLRLMQTFNDPRLLWDRRAGRRPTEPTWYEELPIYHAARAFLQHEPERSRRVVKLLFANWLPECDRPFLQRSGVRMVGSWPVYDDPEAPPSARVVAPEQLDHWMETALLASLVRPAHTFLNWALDRERRARAGLILNLAEQLYARQHGVAAERPENLVGVVLDRLPAGYEPELPVAGPRPAIPSIAVEYRGVRPALDLLGPGPRPEK